MQLTPVEIIELGKTLEKLGFGAPPQPGVSPQPIGSEGINIVVLQRGHVVVGELSRQGDQCYLRKCAVVRVWGTSKGLGEIAKDGPTAKTVLDKVPEVIRFHELTTIMTIKCVDDKWTSALQ